MSRKSSLSLHGDLQASIFSPYFDKGARRISAAPFSLAVVLPEAESASHSNTGMKSHSNKRSRSTSTPFTLPIQPPPTSFTSEVKMENGEGENETLILRVGRKLSTFIPKHQGHLHTQGASATKPLQIGIQKEVQVMSETTNVKLPKKDLKSAKKETTELRASGLDRSYTLPSGPRQRPKLRPIVIPKLPYTPTPFIIIQDPPIQTPIADNGAQPTKVKDEGLTPLQAEFSAIHDPPPLPPPKSARLFSLTPKKSVLPTSGVSGEPHATNYRQSTFHNDRDHKYSDRSDAQRVPKGAPYTPSLSALFDLLGVRRGNRKNKGGPGRKSSLRRKTSKSSKSSKRKMVPRSPTMSSSMYYQTHSSRMTILSASTSSPQEVIFTLRPSKPSTPTSKLVPVPMLVSTAASTNTAYNVAHHVTPDSPSLRPTSIFDPPLPSPASIISIGKSNWSESNKRDSTNQFKENTRSRPQSRLSTLGLHIKDKPKRVENLPSFLPNIS